MDGNNCNVENKPKAAIQDVTKRGKNKRASGNCGTSGSLI